MKIKHILLAFIIFPLITLAQNNQQKRFSLVGEAAFGFNSNPTLENISTTESSQKGRGKGQNSMLTKSDLETQFSGKAHYKAIKTDSYTLHTNYDLWGDFFAKNSEENFLSHDVSLPFDYYTESHRFELIPSYIYQTQDSAGYLSYLGVEGRFTSRFELFDFTLSSSIFKVDALDESYSYLGGEIISLGGEVLIPLENSELSVLALATQSNNNDEVGNVASYSAAAIIPHYSFSTGNWIHAISLGYEKRDYKEDVKDGFKREDEFKFIRLRPSYLLSKDVAFFVDTKFSNNSSNSTTNSYDQFISLIGINWFVY